MPQHMPEQLKGLETRIVLFPVVSHMSKANSRPLPQQNLQKHFDLSFAEYIISPLSPLTLYLFSTYVKLHKIS